MGQYQPLQAGSLDRRVVLYRYTAGADNGYTTENSYDKVREVYASAKPGGGAERLVNAETAASAPMVFRIRWAPDLTNLNPKDRVEYPVGSGQLWDIFSVFEMGRRDGIEIAARRRVD